MTPNFLFDKYYIMKFTNQIRFWKNEFLVVDNLFSCPFKYSTPKHFSVQDQLRSRFLMRNSKYISEFLSSKALLWLDFQNSMLYGNQDTKKGLILTVWLWTTLCLSYFTLFISDSTMTAQKSRLHSSDDVTNNMTGPSEQSWVCPPPPWFW